MHGVGDDCDRRSDWGLIGSVVLATFSVSLSISCVAVALPNITRDTQATPLTSSLMIIVPQLVGTALMLPTGRLGDLLGRRRSYLWALATFALSSLVIVAVSDPRILVLLQVPQAAAAAAVWANSAAVLFDSLSAHQFRRALGYYIGAVSAGDLAGPTLGGIVTTALGWRWNFALLALIGAGCLVLGHRALPKQVRERRQISFDFAGAALVILLVSCVTVGPLIAQASGSLDRRTVLGWIAAAVLIVILRFVEKRRRHPLVEPQLFAARRLRLALASGMLNAAAQWVPSVLLVLYFQAHDGATAMVAGVLVLPLPVTTVVASIATRHVSRHAASDRLAVWGSTVALAGLAGIPLALDSPYPVLFVMLLILGVGSGIYSVAIADLLLEESPSTSTGSVNGARLTIQNLGWMLSTSLTFILVTAHLTEGTRRSYFAGTAYLLGDRDTAGLLLVGYQQTFAVLAAVALVATTMTVLLRRDPPAVPARR